MAELGSWYDLAIFGQIKPAIYINTIAKIASL